MCVRVGKNIPYLYVGVCVCERVYVRESVCVCVCALKVVCSGLQ